MTTEAGDFTVTVSATAPAPLRAPGHQVLTAGVTEVGGGFAAPFRRRCWPMPCTPSCPVRISTVWRRADPLQETQ